MRILFISAFYPPHEIGGWEQLTYDINQHLITRGHSTHVLTSTFGVEKPKIESGISRLLDLESNLYHYKLRDFYYHKRRIANNINHTTTIIKHFKPDLVFAHGMYNLSKVIPWLVEQLVPRRVVYYIANDWPYVPDSHTAYWNDPARRFLPNLAKRVFGLLPIYIIKRENERYHLEFNHVICVSQAVKDDLAKYGKIPTSNMSVIYNGVETDLFIPEHRHSENNHWCPSLLYAGSLVQHKGVHTAIEAMALLSRKKNTRKISLTIVGSGHPDYESFLHKLVDVNNLSQSVFFRNRIPRTEMPHLFREFNILVFPSTWEEPLSRIMQEAMSAGLVVVGTVTGGSGELLVDGETGLTFPPGNPTILARRIEELKQNPTLHVRLSKNARKVVVAKFDINRMVDEIEAYLEDVIKPSSAIPGSVKHNEESLRAA
jgi:glycogen synthase